MSSVQDPTRSDAEFERSLLESARDDAPTRGTAEAWASLCAAWPRLDAEPVAPGTTPAQSVRPGESTRAECERSVPRPVLSSRSASGWFLLGGIGGSLLTAILLGAFQPWLASSSFKPTEPPAPSTATAPNAAPAGAVAVLRAEPSPSDVAQPRAAEDTPDMRVSRVELQTEPRVHSAVEDTRRGASALAADSTASVRGAARGTRPRASNGAAAVESELHRATRSDPAVAHAAAASSRDVEPSTLAAEISALEAAHASFRAGWFTHVRRLIDDYHRDFPHSVLAPDAEEVAIEALAATRDDVELRARAEAFLARYPRDPHAPRIEQLLHESRER